MQLNCPLGLLRNSRHWWKDLQDFHSKAHLKLSILSLLAFIVSLLQCLLSMDYTYVGQFSLVQLSPYLFLFVTGIWYFYAFCDALVPVWYYQRFALFTTYHAVIKQAKQQWCIIQTVSSLNLCVLEFLQSISVQSKQTICCLAENKPFHPTNHFKTNQFHSTQKR